MNIPIKIFRKLTKQRNFLQQVTQISFSYNSINKRYPFDRLDERQALELIEIYSDLIGQINKLNSESYENSAT